MKRGTPGHPKMMQLADKLDISLPLAVGTMEMLWHFVAQYARHGNIGKFSNRMIANALHWQGDHNVLIDALVDSRWLDHDPNPDNRLLVHDWWENCEDAVHSQIARAKEYFSDGRAPKTTKLHSEERKAAAKFYENSPENAVNCVSEEAEETEIDEFPEVVEIPTSLRGISIHEPLEIPNPLHGSQAIAMPSHSHAMPSSSEPAKAPRRRKPPDDDEKTKVEVVRAQLVSWRYSPSKRGEQGYEYRPRPDDDVCQQILRECGGSTERLAEFLREKSKIEPVVNGWGWFPQAIRNQLTGVVT